MDINVDKHVAAFPRQCDASGNGEPGMTYRMYVAALYMAQTVNSEGSLKADARSAVEAADALIDELTK